MFLRVLSPRGNKSLHRSIYAFAPTERVPTLFSFLRQFQSRYARADGPMGFRKAFATVSSYIGPAGGVGRVCYHGALLVVVLCIRVRRGVRTNVKNDPVRDIPGAGTRGAVSRHKYLLRSPAPLFTSNDTRNYARIYC